MPCFQAELAAVSDKGPNGSAALCGEQATEEEQHPPSATLQVQRSLFLKSWREVHTVRVASVFQECCKEEEQCERFVSYQHDSYYLLLSHTICY